MGLVGIDGVLTNAGSDALVYPKIGELIRPYLPVTDKMYINVVRERENLIIEEKELMGDLFIMKDDEGKEVLKRELKRLGEKRG